MTHPGILFMRALSHLPLGAVRGLGTLLGACCSCWRGRAGAWR